MDFGRVDESILDTVDFTLAQDGQLAGKLLKGQPAENPRVYIGCAKWGRKDWIGKLYPKGTKEADFLDHYVKHFNAIELNATHYNFHPAATIRKWADKAGTKEFLFCPKINQKISHFGKLNSDEARRLTDVFLEGISHFGNKLGPVFLQLSDRFGPKRSEEIYAYVDQFPRDIELFVEVRHEAWYSDPVVRSEFFATLSSKGAGSVITDAAGRRDCCHMELTTPATFVRFVGNSLHPTDYTRIDEWVERIHTWLDKGMERVYFFMHQHDELYSPELCHYLVQKINSRCGLDIKPPGLIQESTLKFE